MTDETPKPESGDTGSSGQPAPKKTFGDEPKPEAAAPKPPEPPKASAGKSAEPDPKLVPGPASRTFGKPKERKGSGVWGPLLFLFLILAGGIGAGGYFLYEEQRKFQDETRAKFIQLEDQIAAIHTDADLTRKNQQSIDALNQELQQFKTQMSATVKAHQNSLATLDEDVLRLKEKVERVPAVPPAPESGTGLMDDLALTTPPLVEAPPESRDGDTGEAPAEPQDKRARDTQKFMDWVKNLFGAIWDWFAGLFS